MLDKEVHDINKHYALLLSSLNNVPNLFAIKEIINQINSLKKKFDTIKTDDTFEKIFTKNHLLNLENQRIYIQYLSTRDKEGVDEIIKIFFGDDALSVMRNKLKKFDYDADWNFYLSYQEYSYRAYPSDSPEMQEEYKKILSKLKDDIRKYAEEKYGLKKDYYFDLILGQPYSKNSFFSPSMKRIEISPSTFFAYKDNDNKTHINITSVIQVIFHEFYEGI